MKIISILLGLIGSTFLITNCVQNKQVATASSDLLASKERDPSEIYTELCSGCHGQKVEAFVDRKWKHGNTKPEIIASITNGYVDEGMPTWSAALTKGEIDAMADLIVQSLGTVTQYDFKDVKKQEVYTVDGMTIKLVPVVEGIDVPWGMAVLPDGKIFVTDRSGDLLQVNTDGNKIKIKGLPEALSEGQGGMLDLKLHPKYASNGFVYISYSKSKEEDGEKLSTTAVIRGQIENGNWVNSKEVFEALPYSKTRHHYGSRLEFNREGYLFISVGDRGNRDENPQSLASQCGKIHRINDDGSIPTDNPFYKQNGAMKTIWSYGHRNPQGLALNPTTNQLWETEHGPRGGDEVNIIEKGKNFGWPVISYGINYDGTTFTTLTEKKGMEQPQIYWLPSIAPSGLTFVTGDKYPGWKSDLLAGSLRFNYVNRCVMKNNKIVKEEKVLLNIGRTRNIIQGQDGFIYVSVEKPGIVYKLQPL
ncbi:Glucose/arabinose dehydrogenase, beta-propeller fold [Spirosomataceae bacterium TFI 002]|nr:Glucose/arabinose dehydrogenase, beta-propeller fold [Spirosomataceae bacterium TFI 002]